MRFLALSLAMVGLVLSCGDGDRSRSVAPAGKASTDCSLADILAGTCADTEDPTLDEVPAGYEAPVDSTESESAGTDSTDAGTAAADSTDAGTAETEGADADTVVTERAVVYPVEAESAFVDTVDIEAADLAYFELFFDDDVSSYEQRLIREVVLDMDRVILSGHRFGLKIHFETNRPSHMSLGGASVMRDNGKFITECFVSLLSVKDPGWEGSNRNHLFKHPSPVEFFKDAVYHEVAHCLGFGMGSKWESLMEYRKLPEFRGLWVSRFTGDAARIEFLSATGSPWDEEAAPLIPAGGHLASMFDGWFGGDIRARFTRLYAAILTDLGYEVDYGLAVPNLYPVGMRWIYSDNGSIRRSVGVEHLLFPDRLLEFVPDCGPRMYCMKDRAEGENGLHDLANDVLISDPSIIFENTYWLDGFTPPVRAAKPVVSHSLSVGGDYSWCGVSH